MSTWHIIQTVGQRERWVGAELNRAIGLHWYVPIEVNKITRRNKIISAERPLLACYLFVLGLEDAVWHDVQETRGVVRILTGGRAAMAKPLSDDELARVREMENWHNKYLEDSRTFRVGDRVRVKDGPFATIESLLRAVRGQTATIEVPMLGSHKAATVNVANLEKVA